MYFEIRNSVESFVTMEEITQFFKKGYTTKRKCEKLDGLEHGLGLHYLLQEVQTYNGTIAADCVEFDCMFWLIFTLNV